MKAIAYDTETTGLYTHRGHEMFSYSTADADLNIEVQRLDTSAVARAQAKRKVEKLFDGSNEVVMHNSKFDLRFTEKFLGKQLAERITFHDTYLEAHLLMNNHPTHRLKDLGYDLAGIPKDDEDRVRNFCTEDGDYQKVPQEIMHEYQVRDAKRTMLLHLFLHPRLQASPKLNTLYKTERDLVTATMRMEERGIMLDRARTESMIVELEAQAEDHLHRVWELCGERLNPSKPEHLSRILFDLGGIAPKRFTEKARRPKTDMDTLLELAEEHDLPVVDEILKYSTRKRGASMFRGYLRFADADGTIHPDIRTCGAITGREACKNPNLQNVQKETGKHAKYSVPARKAFRPRPGYVNFHIDYSGIEMRLIVHYAGEPELVDILRRNGDVHEPACLLFFGDAFRNATDPKEKKRLRNISKNGHFALGYGAGGAKLAMTLGKTFAEGVDLHRQYRNRFPKVAELGMNVAAGARKNGYVESIFGRKLFVPREKAYVGTNYLIQSTAADILKVAQVRVHKYLEETTHGEVRILLPIHDEIIVEYPRKRLGDANDLFRDVHKLMTDFPMFSVPIETEMEYTTNNWADKKKWVTA